MSFSNDFPPSSGERDRIDQAEESSLFYCPIFLERTPHLMDLCMPSLRPTLGRGKMKPTVGRRCDPR